ncbi:hexosaminidase D isoform X2 [Lampris incognitus]|uniref:hexosaminidase D isoform X2 n=1 Tax=Lampris incognitus TaxID=2546036 RepID=UPI0024B601E0|nr:hexosaminidase D isoform X2 [Lampris incognitus]
MKFSPWPQGQKLVHLDLKGAPPRIEYLHKLIDLFSRLGADGLLVEYEDMFPYEGELSLLQATAHPAYSREEVLCIQDVARSRGLEVIPLVQTFGHMEVYLLGEGEESKHWLASSGHTVEQLFLSHVTRVAKAIKEMWPQLNIVMWDDMMREMSHDTLKASGLVGLVQPMLWDYNPDLDVDKAVSLLEKYCHAGLPDLWAASSFKGSTSVHTSVTSTQRHVDNHLQWLKVAAAVSPGVRLQGIALTGWQKYDHLSVLCELMPVALPSLAACLKAINHGQFNPEDHIKVMESLGISSVEVEAMERTSEGESLFPGRKLAELIVDLTSLLNSEDLRYYENSMVVRGWLTPYHRQRKIVNPLMTMQIQSHATMLLTLLKQKVEAVREEMLRLYPDSTAQEWIGQHVEPVVAPLQRITQDIGECLLEMMPQTCLPSSVQQ